MPSARVVGEVSNTLKDGRLAGRGTSPVETAWIGTHPDNTPRATPSSWIATARSYQLATPASAQWWIPDRSARRTIDQSASARLGAQDGLPNWAAKAEALRG